MILDGIIIGLLLLGRLALGLAFSRRQTSTREYFLADQKMSWWPVGLSIIASVTSGISFIGHPARVFRYDAALIFYAVSVILIIPVVMYAFLPFYRRLAVTTAYEYLERRFGLSVRLVSSALFILKRLFWMALIVLVPSTVFSTISGIPVEHCVLVVGLSNTLYTALGGLRAIIWADVATLIVLVGAEVLITGFVAARTDGGIWGVLRTGIEHHKAWASMDWDFSRLTLWTVLISGLVFALSETGADQASVQLLLSTKDEKNARKSLVFMALAKIPAFGLIMGMGVAIWVFYKNNPGLLTLAPAEYDRIVPFFVMTQLPSGVVGIILGAILCATMSTFDSGLNALVAALSVDWDRRFLRPGRDDRVYLRRSKVLVFVLGAIISLLSLTLYLVGFTTLIDQANKFLGFFGGSLVGIFLLGMLTARAKAIPTLVGCVASVGFIFVLDTVWKGVLHENMYVVVGCVGTMAIGYGASFFGARADYDRIRDYTLARPPGAVRTALAQQKEVQRA